METASSSRSVKGRTRTLPGKYLLGSWQSLPAADVQKVLEERIIATERLVVVRCLYPRGSGFEAHVHPQEQITIVERGVLQFEVNGDALRVGPGQMISIWPGVMHSSRVLGEEPVCALHIFQAMHAQPHSARLGRSAKAPRDV
ncbi:MAG: cupin domain-containing protein [Candidatus Eisenbacteria bacterium]